MTCIAGYKNLMNEKHDLIERARVFTIAAHKAVGQRRKYSGDCYSIHPEEVAAMVAERGGTAEMIAASWLHDTVEDTHVTLDDIRAFFGEEIADLVYWLTDISKKEDGNRRVRKAIDRAHLAKAPAKAQTIKYCDSILNTRDIAENDPKFAKVYLPEKMADLEAMDRGDPELRAFAINQVNEALNCLENETASQPKRSFT